MPHFDGYKAIWLASGTQALALALSLIRARNPDVADPEVVLPAYGCPDIAAAAFYASIRPVLVDTGGDDPGIDRVALLRSLTDRTIAVVAANFLGIRERLGELRTLLQQWPRITLVQDDAQTFPEAPSGADLRSDYVCLSFGRGKPVSLLGGGALLLRKALAAPEDLRRLVLPAESVPAVRWKIRAFNFLSRPSWYGLVSRVPFASLGRTRFKPLRHIMEMDAQRRRLLPANVLKYGRRGGEVAVRIREMLPAGMDLPSRLGPRTGRLLRYPVLCESRQQRDALWRKLRVAGLGATGLYERPLGEIDGVGGRVEIRTELKGARQFADRLLTLPVHCRVGAKDVARMARIVQRYGSD